MRATSRTEYQTRINRVLGYIEDHVGEDIALDRLARTACLSPFHFHRVFKSMTGESVNAFVQRRRLEKAARQLHANRTATVLEVAVHHGYDNGPAFSRAFRRLFGVAPTEWRRSGAEERRTRLLDQKKRTRDKESKIGTAIHVPVWQKLTSRVPPATTSATKMTTHRATVEDLPRVHAIGMRYVGP